MFIMSYIGDQVWLMTSRQTEPDLAAFQVLAFCRLPVSCLSFASSHLAVLVLGCCASGANLQLVDIWVEYAVREADARRLVWVLIG